MNVQNYFISFNPRLYSASEWIQHCVRKLCLSNSSELEKYYNHPRLHDNFKKQMIPNWEKPKPKPEHKPTIVKKKNYSTELTFVCGCKNSISTYIENGKSLCDVCCNHNYVNMDGKTTCLKCFIISPTPYEYKHGYTKGETSYNTPFLDEKTDLSKLSYDEIRALVLEDLNNPDMLNVEGYESEDEDYINPETNEMRPLEEVIEIKIKKFKIKHKPKRKPRVNTGGVKPKNNKVLNELLKYEESKEVTEKCLEIFEKYLTNLGKVPRGRNRKIAITVCFYYALKNLNLNYMEYQTKIIKLNIVQKEQHIILDVENASNQV